MIKKGKAHYVDTPDFKYEDTISGVVNDTIEDITGAPWFCYVDSVSIKNTETSLMQMFELDSCNKENIKIEVCSLVNGWIARDARIIPDKKTLLLMLISRGKLMFQSALTIWISYLFNKSKSIDNV